MIAIPHDLQAFWSEQGEEARDWLARLPGLVAECAQEWQLELGEVFEAGYSVVVAVTRADGTPAVLKLTYPERENEHEAEGLRRWRGNATVRLYDADAGRSALLLERVEPGTQLWELDDDTGIRIAAALLPRLWIEVEQAHPFDTVSELASGWGEHARELARTQGEQVLLHRDYHRGNVLAAGREPWLVIDPKPVVGEREFDAAWLLGDRLEPASAPRRLDLLARELHLDRDRLRRWGTVRYAVGAQGFVEPGWEGGDEEMLAVAAAIRSA